MKQRFYKLTGGCCPPVQFGTFHAIFYHILRQNRQYREFSLITETEKRKLLLQIIKMPQSLVFTGCDKIEYLIRTISHIKNNGECIENIVDGPFTTEEIRYIYKEYNEFMAEFQPDLPYDVLSDNGYDLSAQRFCRCRALQVPAWFRQQTLLLDGECIENIVDGPFTTEEIRYIYKEYNEFMAEFERADSILRSVYRTAASSPWLPPL